MSVNDIFIPEDLMNNVEQSLRNHMTNKKKRRKIYAASIALVLALGIPASVFAYNNYVKNIPYSQEIDLARQNNTITKLDATFKYKDVEFRFKEAVADETGLVVLYDVSNPKYSISSFRMTKADGSDFPELGMYTPNNDDKQTEKGLYASVKGDSITYMKNNPVVIKVQLIKNGSTDKVAYVDWSLKLQVPVQEVKSIAINKEQKLDIGTIKFKSLNISALKTYLDYEFIPSDKNITQFSPIFSYRIDGEYLDSIHDNKSAVDFWGVGEEFKTIYYSNRKEVGITLIGSKVIYKFSNPLKYYVDKNKVPMDFEFNGEKGIITSVKKDKNSTEYTFEFDKDNRNFSDIELWFDSTSEMNGSSEKVIFKDQGNLDRLYEILVNKIPNFKQIYVDSGINKAYTKLQVQVPNEDSKSFEVGRVSKNFLYDLDEIVVKP